MKMFRRITALVALAAFIGLSTVETFHCHKAHQTQANCAVCQIAHRTPAILSTKASVGPQLGRARTVAPSVLPTYVQFVFVSHGLSPPVL